MHIFCIDSHSFIPCSHLDLAKDSLLNTPRGHYPILVDGSMCRVQHEPGLLKLCSSTELYTVSEGKVHSLSKCP